MICEVNDKRVLMDARCVTFSCCDGWRIYGMKMECMDEYYFLGLDLLD